MKKDLQPLISAYIASYRSSHPYSPTIREIADGTGIPRATVGRAVEKMRALGLLEYSGHRKILPSGQKPSVESFLPVPVYLTEDACIRSVPDGTALLPSAWTGPGEFFLLAAPEACAPFGIRAGDPVLVRTSPDADPSLPVLFRTPDGRLGLRCGLPCRNGEPPAVLGTAVRVFRRLPENPPQETAPQGCPL